MRTALTLLLTCLLTVSLAPGASAQHSDDPCVFGPGYEACLLERNKDEGVCVLATYDADGRTCRASVNPF